MKVSTKGGRGGGSYLFVSYSNGGSHTFSRFLMRSLLHYLQFTYFNLIGVMLHVLGYISTCILCHRTLGGLVSFSIRIETY